MAIKTKKITDLGKITIDEKNIKLTDGDFYVIGCKAGVTGKVATNEIVESIKIIIKKAEIEESISSLTSSIETISKEKIAELEDKVAALEGFVQALQEEGYLTLAKIKQAAAEACPICTHTHEEEQPTE